MSLLLSDKYIAGFLDGDGSLRLENGRLVMSFHQKRANDGVIELISQVFPHGTLCHKQGRRRGTVTYGTTLTYTGQRAVDYLCRLKPYLVTKRVRANRLLCELGFSERVGTDSIPVYPSRKWLAGYFDADGCIFAGMNNGGGGATVKFSVDTDAVEKDGIMLIQKAFGGDLRSRGATGNCWRWEVRADAAKAKAFLTPIAKHLLIKREQAYFVLGCAERMGHFRDGQTICNTLKVMKTHPHRLSDLTPEVDVSAYLAEVQDLQPAEGRRYRMLPGQVCGCGATKLYAKGKCSPCWQRDRYHSRVMRQSELAA